MNVTMLYTRIRVEERLLLDAFERRGIAVNLLRDEDAVLELDGGGGDASSPLTQTNVLFDRCLSETKSEHIIPVFEAAGVPCVNRTATLDVCGDKLRTTLALTRAGVPSPRTVAAYSPAGAIEAAERIGYPVVLKPTTGSWGRLIARLNDRDALEAVIEHKTTLGDVRHGVIYLQEYIDKPAGDIRAFVINGRTVAAIRRISDHWITNTARGARVEAMEVTTELDAMCVRAAEAVGGGILAIDLVEDPQRGLLVIEVNAKMEFRNSIEPTGVDLPGLMVAYVLEQAQQSAMRRTDTPLHDAPNAPTLTAAGAGT